MWTLWIVNFLLWHQLASSQLEISALQTADPICNKQKYEILYSFFRRQTLITVVSSANDDFSKNFRCSGLWKYRPVISLRSIEHLKNLRKPVQSSVTSLPSIHGFYVKADGDDIVNKIIPCISKFNSKAKLMIEVSSDQYSVVAVEGILKIHEQVVRCNIWLRFTERNNNRKLGKA